MKSRVVRNESLRDGGGRRLSRRGSAEVPGAVVLSENHGALCSALNFSIRVSTQPSTTTSRPSPRVRGQTPVPPQGPGQRAGWVGWRGGTRAGSRRQRAVAWWSVVFSFSVFLTLLASCNLGVACHASYRTSLRPVRSTPGPFGEGRYHTVKKDAIYSVKYFSNPFLP